MKTVSVEGRMGDKVQKWTRARTCWSPTEGYLKQHEQGRKGQGEGGQVQRADHTESWSLAECGLSSECSEKPQEN